MNRIKKYFEVRFFWDLVIILSLIVTFLLLVKFQNFPIVRFLMSGFMLFFAPGYTLTTALYPYTDSIRFSQRILMSFGMSPVISALLLLMTAFLFGITLDSALFILITWILLTGVITIFRRYRAVVVHEDHKIYTFDFQINPRKMMQDAWPYLLIFGVLIIFGGRLLVVTNQSQPQYTEMYLLGEEGKANDYTETVVSNGVLDVHLVVVNKEQNRVDYLLAYGIEDGKFFEDANFSLFNKNRWEETISLNMPSEPGIYKIDFQLYDSATGETKATLHYWIDVKN